MLQNERGRIWQPKSVADYYAMTELNPSSICDGFVGVGEVDVSSIRHSLLTPDRKTSQAAQDRMDRGTLVHMALLQPERLATDVAVWEGARRAGAEWDAFEDENQNKLILTRKDYAASMEAANAVTRHPEVCRLLNGCKSEVAMQTRWLGVECRGMVDAVSLDNQVIVDIKTTDAGIGQRSVDSTIQRFFYREKMAAYRMWLAHITDTFCEDWRCWNLFISMEPPYGIRACKFTTMAMEYGECRVNDAVTKYAAAAEANEWPVYFYSDVVDVKPWETEQEIDDVEY